MTSSVVINVIRRARQDRDFAVQIIKDPKRTLATYNLTKTEITQVIDQVKEFEIRGIWPAD